jgi:hypothetical protein
MLRLASIVRFHKRHCSFHGQVVDHKQCLILLALIDGPLQTLSCLLAKLFMPNCRVVQVIYFCK